MRNLTNLKNLLPDWEEIKQEKARRSFWQFCLYYDQEFFDKRPFLKEVAEIFQWVYDEYIAGRPRRAAISMPPRAGKSYITSLFCAWWLGKLPELSVMRNSCTARLYQKFSYDVRNIIRSEIWQSVFDTPLAPDKQSVDGWNLQTAKQVSYFGGGVGGTIIGFGANLAISDDLYKSMEDALSENVNESVHSWKQSAHDSRKELNCPEIFIGTRWTSRDVIGKALEAKKIEKEIKIAALTPENKSFCEHVKRTEEYLDVKADMEESIWEAEYMQEPIESKGLLFPKASLKFYNEADFAKAKAEYVYIPIDPADKGGDNYSSPVGVVVGNAIYIPEVIFNKDDTDINIPATVENAVKYNANYIEVEGNSGWRLAGKDIRNLTSERLPDCEVRIIVAITNKETRILRNSAWIKNHVYFNPNYEDSKEYKAFIKNLTSYLKEGDNANDDAPDVLSQLADYCRVNLSHLFK